MADLLGMLTIGLGVALQFVPLYRARLAPLVARWPLARILYARAFQLVAGFFLLLWGIQLL
ncbi:MAG: hypothetical protein RLW62_11445 [Gammaproteobacteria bacterium]